VPEGTWWMQIAEALRRDFSDLPDIGHVTQMVVRLSVAAFLGGLLGYEREKAGKAAGLRTHMLVAIGAALYVLIPQQAGVSAGDMTRVLQGLVTGIGFLGAGAILKNADEGHVEGLTTAASIWLTAAIGIAAGMGREVSAILSTVLALFILSAIPRIESLLEFRRPRAASPPDPTRPAERRKRR
jgi:putative Mg2+ transporter-C (MgtC) family protein